MAEKATVMVLKVDLQCPYCYEKVKKILCKFPQIRNQVYDVKANTVTITVVCCNPEKLRDKLCCKGCKVIKSIEIKEPKEKPNAEPEKKPKSEGAPPSDPTPPKTGSGKPPVDGYPPTYSVPVRTCCGACYEGYGGGPCYHGYGVPPPPQPCYDVYYVYGYGPCRGCHVCKCGYYFSHDDPRGCYLM